MYTINLTPNKCPAQIRGFHSWLIGEEYLYASSVDSGNGIDLSFAVQPTPADETSIKNQYDTYPDCTSALLARDVLVRRVADEYDTWIGIIDCTTSFGTYGLSERDRTNIADLTNNMQLAGKAPAEDCFISPDTYRFSDGQTRALLVSEANEIALVYGGSISARYNQHLRVKSAVSEGNLPAEADYVACGLVLADFDGCELI